MKNLIEQTYGCRAYGRICVHLAPQVLFPSPLDFPGKVSIWYNNYFTYAKYLLLQEVIYKISRQSADHE